MVASGMPWIKLYTEFLDDPKVGFLDEGSQLLLVKLFLLAGESDSEGYLANGDELLTKEHLAWRLRIAPDVFVDRWAKLEKAGFVQEEEDGALLVVKFQDRQGRTQSDKRRMWRERKQRQRETTTGHEPESDESHAGVTRDSEECPSPREEKRREEVEEEPKGGEAPAAVAAPSVERRPPQTLAEWKDAVDKYGNPPALVRRMIELHYPGMDPPDYETIGGFAKKMGQGNNGYKRLVTLIWQQESAPPSGDLLPYLLRVHQGKERENGSRTRKASTKPVITAIT